VTKNLAPIGSTVLTFIGYKQTNKQTDRQTDRQAKFIYRKGLKEHFILIKELREKFKDRDQGKR